MMKKCIGTLDFVTFKIQYLTVLKQLRFPAKKQDQFESRAISRTFPTHSYSIELLDIYPSDLINYRTINIIQIYQTNSIQS